MSKPIIHIYNLKISLISGGDFGGSSGGSTTSDW